MRLYHHPFSLNARRAVMTALHLRAPVELVLVDLSKGEHMRPEFLQMNPNHKVPVLEDGDLHLWESHAIIQYLADRTPGHDLYPTELRARADINRWLFWSSQHFTPAVSILNWEHAIKGILGLGGPDPVEVKRGEGQFAEFAKVLDAHLANRDWISGNHLTLADLALAVPLGHAVPAKLPVSPYANMQRWLGQVQALDAWKQTELRR